MSLVFNAIVHAIHPEEPAVLLDDAVVDVINRRKTVDIYSRLKIRCREILSFMVIGYPRKDAEKKDKEDSRHNHEKNNLYLK